MSRRVGDCRSGMPRLNAGSTRRCSAAAPDRPSGKSTLAGRIRSRVTPFCIPDFMGCRRRGGRAVAARPRDRRDASHGHGRCRAATADRHALLVAVHEPAGGHAPLPALHHDDRSWLRGAVRRAGAAGGVRRHPTVPPSVAGNAARRGRARAVRRRSRRPAPSRRRPSSR